MILELKKPGTYRSNHSSGPRCSLSAGHDAKALLVVESIDSSGLPISVRYEVVGFLKDTNRVRAYTFSYRPIRAGMKVFDMEIAFFNEEGLIEAIHEEMLLIVVKGKGTPPYFDFDDHALCTMPYSSLDDDNPN